MLRDMLRPIILLQIYDNVDDDDDDVNINVNDDDDDDLSQQRDNVAYRGFQHQLLPSKAH